MFFQVPPAELEHLLQSNPEIADAAVIPYVPVSFYLLAAYTLFATHAFKVPHKGDWGG